MAFEIRVQKDYYLTEVSLDLPVSIARVDEVLRETKTNGKVVILYSQGHIVGINIEQRTKISPAQSAEIRPLLAIGEKIL